MVPERLVLAVRQILQTVCSVRRSIGGFTLLVVPDKEDAEGL
jgi:hypothetical protein